MNIFSLLPRERQHRSSFSTPQTNFIVNIGLIPYALCWKSPLQATSCLPCRLSKARTFQLTGVLRLWDRRAEGLCVELSRVCIIPRPSLHPVGTGALLPSWSAATRQFSTRPPRREGKGEGTLLAPSRARRGNQTGRLLGRALARLGNLCGDVT